MESILKEKFRKLHDTQTTVVSTADYILENSAESKTIVKAWNQEFTNAKLGKKLTLLYLANDVLQRCKTNTFLTEFLHYLPKATAHLYKYGDKECRSNLDRLVEVWDDRKVLRTRGIAAVRSQLEKVKSTTQDSAQDNERSGKEAKSTTHSQNSKRKRTATGAHPIVDGLDEVQEAASKTTQTENELKKFLGSREVGTLDGEQLRWLQELNGKHYESVKREVHLRKKLMDFLRETLTEQEEDQKKAKEMHRLCIERKGEIESRLGSTDQTHNQQPSQSLIEETPTPKPTPTLSTGLVHSFGGGVGGHVPPLPYPVSLMQQNADFSFGPPAPMGPPPPLPPLASHSIVQQIHPGSFFPMLRRDQRQDKPQDPQMNSVYHHNGQFLSLDYLQNTQAHQLPPYPPHSIQDMHGNGGSFVRQLKYEGYQEQYDPEKDWDPDHYSSNFTKS